MAPHLTARARPQLPAFCQTRRHPSTVSQGSLNALRSLLGVVVLLQLGTVMLVAMRPMPPAPERSIAGGMPAGRASNQAVGP